MGNSQAHAAPATVEAGADARPQLAARLIFSLRDFFAANSARRNAVLISTVGVLLCLPALWVGFAQDDRYFLAIFKGTPGLEAVQQAPWNTYTFSEGDAALNQLRMERGVLPWWTVPDWKVNMWRPLASMTHWADYQLFGERALPMHLHSLALYGLLLLAAAALYRRMMPQAWVAALAALLYGVDSAHGVPAGWLANRHALLTGLFVVLTLLAHDAWRRPRVNGAGAGKGWWPWAPLASLALAIGLFCGEAAVAAGAYLFAYALFMDPAARDHRGRFSARGIAVAMACLLPYLLVVIGWRAVYVALGHGAAGSWLYVDPLVNPLVFSKNAALYLPVMLFGLFGPPDATLWIALPASLQILAVAFTYALLVAAAWVVWPMLRQRNDAKFWAVSALLAVLPFCATIPSDRNLTIPGIGAMALIALFVAGVFERAPWRLGNVRWRATAGGLATGLVACHLILSPAVLTITAWAITGMDRVFHHANASVALESHDPEQRVVVLNTPLDLLGASLPLYGASRDMALPKNWLWLTAGPGPVQVERIDDYTLHVQPDAGFLQRPWAQIFRRPETHPMVAGERIDLGAMTAQVLSVENGRPTHVRFTFDVPLEDPSLRWLTWADGAYEPYTPPTRGAETHTPDLDAMKLVRVVLGLDAPAQAAVVAQEPTTPDTKRSTVKEASLIGKFDRSGM